MILLLSNFQVEEMPDDETCAWTKFADIASNARIANEVEFFRQNAAVARRTPAATHSASRALIAASRSGSTEGSEARSEIREGSANTEPLGALRAVPDASGVFEERESGAASGEENGAEGSDAKGGKASGFEFESCGPDAIPAAGSTVGDIVSPWLGGTPGTADPVACVTFPALLLSAPPQELNSDGAKANVAEGSILVSRDVDGTPSETELIVTATAGARGCCAVAVTLTPSWLPGVTISASQEAQRKNVSSIWTVAGAAPHSSQSARVWRAIKTPSAYTPAGRVH